ncbi:MAG: thiamine phosphate synthase [Bacillota bacterium]|jgi:thiamine-phosphate diphosphorylase
MLYDKKNLSSSLPLYLITSRQWLNGAPFVQEVEKALKNGVTCLQVREKDLPFQHFRAVCLPLKKLCLKYQIPFIINDNIDLVIDLDADGLHIGQEDLSAVEARRILGNKKIIGVSVQTLKQALRAQRDGADYLGVGSIFPTSSKVDANQVDLYTLKEICRHVNIPVVAIGGINKDNIYKLKELCIAGIAVISAILAAPDIAVATREIKQAAQKIIGTDNKIMIKKIAPQGMIFDMDGTLLDSLPAWSQLTDNFLLKFQVNPPPDIHKIIEKFTLEESAKYFADNFPVSMTGREILAQWRQEMSDQYKYHIKLKPGVKEFVSIMYEKGVKMCVATLTDKNLAQIALERLGVAQYMQFIITVEEAGQRKTNPKIYLEAAKKLGCDPQDCMVFEDALYAVSAAKNAGFSVCGIIDDLTIDYEGKLKQICDLTINSFEEIL